MPRIYRTFAFCALLCASILSAQTITPKKILFTGAPQYPQADLLATSGLKPGTPLTMANINAAAQALADTGFFSNVNFAYDNVALTYKLVPMQASSLLPVSYEDLLWWTPEELNAELHHRHPLFTTLVPQSGKLQDALLADITAMLAEKGITATVEPIASMKGDAITFQMTSPPVRTHTIQINGLDPALATSVESARKSFVGQEFSDTATSMFFQKGIREAIQDEGYLDATLDNYQRSAPTFDGKQVTVDYSITAHAGDRYRITAVNWPGSSVLTQAQFNKICMLKVGEPPSLRAWHGTEFFLKNAYSTDGYMLVKISVEPKLDHTAHLVSYNIAVVPGEQYQFRNLTLKGMSDRQRQELTGAWKMQSGSPYNAEYVKTFLRSNPGLHSFDNLSLKYKQTIDDNIHKVDLELELR